MQVVQNRRNSWLLVCLIGLLGEFYGQLTPQFNHYGISEGLSQSSVNTIVSEINGSVWAGTQDGLNQFDGFEFRSFLKENYPQIRSAFIVCSGADEEGNLWFGTKKELLFFNAQNGIFNSYRNSRTTSAVRQVALCNQGVLTLYDDGQLFLFSIQLKKFKKIDLDSPVRHLIQGPSKTHVISANNTVYLVGDDGEFKHVYSFKNETIYSAFPAGKSLVCFMDKKIRLLDENYRLSHSSLDGFNTTINPRVVGFISLNQGYVVAVKGSGLFIVSPTGQIIQYSSDYSGANGLKSDNINCLYQDGEKVIWVGTERGLSCFMEEENAWRKVVPSATPEKGLISENVWSFAKYESTLLLGTDQGISLCNSQTAKFDHVQRKEFLTGTQDVSVMDIEPYLDSRFLLACFDGLLLFDVRQQTFEKLTLPEKLRTRHEHFYALFTVGNELFIGTSSGLLVMRKASRKIDEVHYKPRDVFRNFLRDSEGTLWTVSDKSGLSVLNTSTLILEPSPFNKLLNEQVKDAFSCLIEPTEKTLLLGSIGSGMVQLNLATGQVKVLDKRNGLPNNVINGILKDAEGTVWVSTNRGLAYIKAKRFDTHYFTRFGEEDFEYNTNAFFTENGTLYFGGIFGFVSFSHDILSAREVKRRPVINRIRLKKATSEWPKANILISQLKACAFEISLPYHRRDFEVWFQPNVLYKSRSMEYKCEIIGETADTSYLGNTNHISFNALAYGTYYLRIYSRAGKNALWTQTPALLTVHIQPPFWGSKLFLWACIIFGALLAYAYVRFQVAKERKERIQLESIVEQRTEEIHLKKEEIEHKNSVILEEKNKVIAQQKLLYLEKINAEKWLNNTLPEQAVKELQRLGKVLPKSYSSATIMFTDVVGFSKISETLSPSRLVNKLDELFKKFDTIVKGRNIEKIKTIGDAYMAVGGIPEANTTHTIDVCLAALLIREYVSKQKVAALSKGKDFWDIRIGVNTGPVTAGIIGNLKIAYDVWGSAVNQAQRMEQLAEPGTIAISETTFRSIEPYFEVSFKGKAPMKSSSYINRYELLRIKPDLSVGGEGFVPNDMFYEISQLHLYSPIKYYSVEAEVLRILEEQLPKNLYYHSVDHTRLVIQAVEHLALREGVRDEGLFLLKTAALFHDLGFTQQYENNESVGVALAQKILPDFGYNDLHIQTVSELIFATVVPHKPVNKMQEIMCDADLDYLGTDGFETISQKLKRELMEKGKISSDKHWDEVQVPFLENHRYFTPTAIASRGPKKEMNLAAVRQRLEEARYR
ncbi:MAG: hypothetical protein FJZ80_04425 [Bacteroidetes bacterium]|nr:hypothetical protein [Bacteroidota bacterium]